MTISSKHPLWLKWAADWELCRHAYEGQRRIKEERTKYLPATSGMIREGFGGPDTEALGEKMYEAYITRAVFHGFFAQTVVGMTSIVHRKPPVIEVPAAMEKVVENLTIDGENLEVMWRKITEAQLCTGRIGALVDVPDGDVANSIPYVALYTAESIINWDNGARRMGRREIQKVVLDESSEEMRPDLSWEAVKQYRLVALSHSVATLAEDGSEIAPDTFVVQVVKDDGDLSPTSYTIPSLGGQELESIPFVFINATDLAPEPCAPPLIDLANICLVIYRAEADYRQSLFMQGQDTLVIIGRTEEQRSIAVGAGATIDLPMGASAQYIGVSSNGLASQEAALRADKEQASTFSVQLLDTKGGQAESGDALRIRVSARTATLSLMQTTAAEAIRQLLVIIGGWMQLSQSELDKIKVEPNLDFVDDGADANEVSLLMTAKATGGLPLADETIHSWLVKHEYTSKTWEEEKKLLDAERTERGDGTGGVPPGEDPFADPTKQPPGDPSKPAPTPPAPSGKPPFRRRF